MRGAERAVEAEVGRRIEPEWRDQGGRRAGELVGLDQHSAVRRLRQRRRGHGEAVAIAAHPAHRAEVVIERAVFLREDDHVSDVLQGAGAAMAGNIERTGNGGGIGRGRTGTGRHGADEAAPILNHHHGPILLASLCRRKNVA